MALGCDYAEDLKTELLQEMAENFFSRRKNLEDDLDHFYMLVTRLRRPAVNALRAWRTFYGLLLAGPEAREFLAGLGQDVDALLAHHPPSGDLCPIEQPFALTRRGRFVKTTRRFYEHLRETVLDYNDGVFADDPVNSRMKRRTPGFHQVKELCAALNAEITAVNEHQTPYCVLSFAHSLDPVRMQQERVTGAILQGDTQKINQDLAFLHIDFADLGLPDFGDLPPVKDVEERLEALCDRLYAARKDDIDRILRESRYNDAPPPRP